ncbi:MAG TPA: cytochrome c oxidase subunit II [Burkholderiales bacterium]|nr:cytochrome c oxidase subunit II [Burkholderiales bacterium]
MTNESIKRGAGLLLFSLYAGTAQSAYDLNLQQPETPIAHQIYELHTLILLVCVFIFCVVFGVMFYAIFRHRKSLGHQAAQFHENTTVEIIWTIIPFFILIGMAYPATKTVLAMKNTSNPDMTIKVTGYQWKWNYDYLQEGISYYSMLSTTQDQIYGRAPRDEHYLLEVDKPLVVPTGKRIRVLITADDVIHSWWVPAFGVKQDAIPGFIRDSWFEVEKPGIYRGQCAELCGKDHGFMPIVVEAKEPKDYEIWLAEQKQAQAATAKVDVNKTFSLDELKAQGEKLFNTTCAACHQVNGKGIPGTFPALDGSKIVNGPKADHLNIVMNGKSGTAMVAFSQQLSDIELASVITYERNAWGNKTGDAIQPSEVKALRK